MEGGRQEIPLRNCSFAQQEGGGPSVPCRGSLHYQRRPGGKCEALVQLIDTVTLNVLIIAFYKHISQPQNQGKKNWGALYHINC